MNLNPLKKHAQALDGAFTAVSRRIDACTTGDEIRAYLDALESEIIETPYGDLLHEHACELAHIRMGALFYKKLSDKASQMAG